MWITFAYAERIEARTTKGQEIKRLRKFQRAERINILNHEA